MLQGAPFLALRAIMRLPLPNAACPRAICRFTSGDCRQKALLLISSSRVPGIVSRRPSPVIAGGTWAFKNTQSTKVGHRYKHTDALETASSSSKSSTLNIFDVHNGVAAVVEIGNPLRANSLSSEMLRALTRQVQDLSKRADLRAVILTGSRTKGQGIFSAGADINEMENLASSKDAHDFIHTIYTLCEAICGCTVPTIARIDGGCFGAGLEIAASCDFRFASKRSVFSMKEVVLGIPSVVHARLLANIIGWQMAKRMTLLGEDYDADLMSLAGLLDDNLDVTLKLDRKIDEVVHTIAHNGPAATRAQKLLNTFWERTPLQEGLAYSMDVFAKMWEDGGLEPKKYMSAWFNRSKSTTNADKSRAGVSEDMSHAPEEGREGSIEAGAPPDELDWNYPELRDFFGSHGARGNDQKVQ